jgi:hypothetical protein
MRFFKIFDFHFKNTNRPQKLCYLLSAIFSNPSSTIANCPSLPRSTRPNQPLTLN